MTHKLKALGLALVAALAVAAISGLTASAETGGHFASSASHTDLTGKEDATHRMHFHADSSSVTCNTAEYKGTVSGSTATSVTITPHYTACQTSNPGDTTVSMNGCAFVFTVSNTPTGDNTVHLECPGTNQVLIDGPNCDIRMGAQTPAGGVAYKNVSGTITAESTVSGIAFTRHNGICVFLGTNGTNAQMTGSVVLKGSSGGSAVSIEATG